MKEFPKLLRLKHHENPSICVPESNLALGAGRMPTQVLLPKLKDC